MRPEGTAGITRALISQKQYTELPQKYYYHGPMFRHERPQKGRLRQVRKLWRALSLLLLRSIQGITYQSLYFNSFWWQFSLNNLVSRYMAKATRRLMWRRLNWHPSF